MALNERCRELASFLAFVEPIGLEWSTFVSGTAEALTDAGARMIVMARGSPISYSRLLEMQRVHAAQHYRQVYLHLASEGHDMPAFALDDLEIELPAQVY